MFRAHKKLGYALIALNHMYQKPAEELTTAKEIAKEYQLSFDAVSRVLQNMVRAGFIKSTQGALGGYCLQKDLSQISFFSLMETVLGPVHISHCMFQNEESCFLTEKCNIAKPMQWLNQQLTTYYHSLTLKKLLENSKEAKNKFTQCL